MESPKNAASLTSGLLARKGTAQPAMRRQTVTGLDTAMGMTGPRSVSSLEDLGWNDMGDDGAENCGDALHPAPAPSPVALHIAAIQETLDRRKADRRAEIAAVPALTPAPAPVAKKPARASRPTVEPASSARGKSAFTLRIDADRHLRLRLLSAVTHRSAQQLLTGALDALLADHPEIDALAANPRLHRSIRDTGME